MSPTGSTVGSQGRICSACIPSKTNRIVQIPHSWALYRKHHLIENVLGCFNYWSRIHTRYDRSCTTCVSAAAVAATVIFWL